MKSQELIKVLKKYPDYEVWFEIRRTEDEEGITGYFTVPLLEEFMLKLPGRYPDGEVVNVLLFTKPSVSDTKQENNETSV